MKENFVHVVFLIDESGSMAGTENDVIGGFKRVIANKRVLAIAILKVLIQLKKQNN